MSINYVLAVPYEQKDSMKLKYGIKWNAEHKMWCAKNEHDYTGLSKYHVVRVNVLFKNKDIFKQLGGQWNGTYNYVHKGLYKKNKEAFDNLEIDTIDTEFSDEDS